MTEHDHTANITARRRMILPMTFKPTSARRVITITLPVWEALYRACATSTGTVEAVYAP